MPVALPPGGKGPSQPRQRASALASPADQLGSLHGSRFTKTEVPVPLHVDDIDPLRKGFILHMSLSPEEIESSIIMLIRGSWEDPPAWLRGKHQQTEPFSSQCPSKALLGEVLPVFCGSFYSGPFQITLRTQSGRYYSGPLLGHLIDRQNLLGILPCENNSIN